MFKMYLLSDETEISENDFLERKELIKQFEKMPETFFSKMRHLQPQIGCLNACAICSKEASTKMSYWTEKRQRNVIAALKYAASNYKREIPYLVWDRNEHRNGVIFSYLDNDIGSYSYLDSFIKILYEELGVKTRISTVGFSRHNEFLNMVHSSINKNCLEGLAGVRLSFTPYAIGWSCSKGDKFSRMDYILDMANFLKIYKPYYNKEGSGYRKLCVELRYKPLVQVADVYETVKGSRKVICTKNYLFVSKDKNIQFKESRIKDAFDHKISLTQDPILFYRIDLQNPVNDINDVNRMVDIFLKTRNKTINMSEVYMLENGEGKYYSIDPKLSENGNYGMNIYPRTENRVNSGYIITERFFLNELLKYKRQFSGGDFQWTHAYIVLNNCKKAAEIYGLKNKKEKSKYILNEIVPMIEAYIIALQEAGYSAKVFFDKNFTIDTGIICNMGRAIKEFKGLTFKENEPLTPNHERNYGRHNSTMTHENDAWRLSCDYNNRIIVEHLNLFDTASSNGQVDYKTYIQLQHNDGFNDMDSLKNNYFIPGQRRR